MLVRFFFPAVVLPGQEAEALERERLEREQSILERQREMLLLLGLTLERQ